MEELLNSRRGFIKNSALITAGIGFNFPFRRNGRKQEELLILHTNDVHSHIHPFDNDHPKYAGQGGVIKRANLINAFRLQHKNVLLLDAGDIFQGTPYFNYYGGELEMKLMSEMKYDAATIGNHDFDGGISGLTKAMEFSNFPMINSNYVFENELSSIVKPYKIFRKGNVKIGVFGLGIELDGLVDKRLFQGTIYTDPISTANKISDQLKNKDKCDYVICLSHLGLKYNGNKVSDNVLAEKTSGIDLIIGGHTHSFLDSPEKKVNLSGEQVLISQAAWAGLRLGVIKVIFKSEGKTTEGLSMGI